MSYPTGRYRFHLPTRTWMSGQIAGPYCPPSPTSFARMSGSVLTSPGGGSQPVDSFVLGTTKPDASTTGVTSGTVLTDVSGDVTLSTAGQVYSGKRVHGVIFIRAANVTVRDCEVLGQSSYTFANKYSLIDCRDGSAQNFLIDRCKLRNQLGQWWSDSVGVRSGASGTIRRCDISYSVDGFSLSGQGALNVLGNYVHGLAFSNNSPNQSGSTPPYWVHSDGIQLSGGSGATLVRGNYFEGYVELGQDDGIHGLPRTDPATGSWDRRYGGGITVSPDNGLVTNLTITENWFEGGSAGFQCSFASEVGTNMGSIDHNRFGMDQYDYGNASRYQIRFKSGINIDGLNTNYFDPDAPSVPSAKRGQTFSVGFATGIRLD
jgi:hypothetical protein